MKYYKRIALTLAFAFGLVGVTSAVVPASTASAAACSGSALSCAKQGYNAGGGSSNSGSLQGFIHKIVNLLLYILGSIAVIVIVIGGIRYTTSAGDQSQMTAAKNTILYAVVGLVVAVLAYAIVNFVLTSI